jgi:hypothetical protein
MNPLMDLFDANCMLGSPALRGPGAPVTPVELLAEMKRVGIARALVYHSLAVTNNPRQGNQLLMEEIAGFPHLLPAWVLAPEFTPAAPSPAALVDQMVSLGVRAARLLPRPQSFELRLWNVGELLEALAERQAPVWIDYGMSSWTNNLTDWNGLAEVLGALPELRVVLVRPDISSGRRLFALMERHSNLFVETSYYTVHQGLAELCRSFGAQRVLFGSGLPARAAGPAITALLYQPIEEEDRRLIAGGNLERLLSEVIL